MYLIAPRAKTIQGFFNGRDKDRDPSIFVITSSLVISWIFAKSITNAANLGQSYGMVGSVSYAAYYLSFIVCGIVLYRLRKRGNYTSIHQFLHSKFGRNAVTLFSILIAFRLLNEVWSNTMVIGSYFGEAGTMHYFIAIIVFTALTLAYTLKGGMSASLLTDVVQMVLFSILLIFVLYKVNGSGHHPKTYIQSGTWSGEGGIYLFFVALLQIFSYPFHDAVMTDRAFITKPSRIIVAFGLSAILGVVFILLFSFIGIDNLVNGRENGEAAVIFSKEMGVVTFLLMNSIMVVSASSTLDSAFTSFGKLAIIDLNIMNKISVSKGKLTIALFTLVGTIPIFFNPTILSATTISGTMVIGLTPIFLFWNFPVPKISYYLSICFGILIGILHVLNINILIFPFQGPYAELLNMNIIGVFGCIVLYFLPLIGYRNKLSS